MSCHVVSCDGLHCTALCCTVLYCTVLFVCMYLCVYVPLCLEHVVIHLMYRGFMNYIYRSMGTIFDTVDTLTSTCSPEPNCEVPPSQSAQEAEDEAWLKGTHDEMYHQVIARELCHFVCRWPFRLLERTHITYPRCRQSVLLYNKRLNFETKFCQDNAGANRCAKKTCIQALAIQLQEDLLKETQDLMDGPIKPDAGNHVDVSDGHL